MARKRIITVIVLLFEIIFVILRPQFIVTWIFRKMNLSNNCLQDSQR